jgi:hypothetical protein
VADGFFRVAPLPLEISRSAWFRVVAEVFPFAGAANFTPARRALDRPMAIACFVDRAPCFPSRTWCISSRTNSPAWVEADLPFRASSLAFSNVSFSGMILSYRQRHLICMTESNWVAVKPIARREIPVVD